VKIWNKDKAAYTNYHSHILTFLCPLASN